MIEETDIETFLYVSKNEYQIFVLDKKKLKNLYNKKLKIPHEFNLKELNYLSKFLDENIFKIEQLFGNFIKNIILIINNNQSLSVNISIKKENYRKSHNYKYLKNNLIEIKDVFKENYQEQTIMHMIVVSHIVNDKNYSSYIANKSDNNLCIEVNFLSISNDLTSFFERLLEKYQIKISHYMCGNYINNFFNDDTSELSLLAYKLKNGFNDNEVILVPKNIENKGFFEKFFQLFS